MHKYLYFLVFVFSTHYSKTVNSLEIILSLIPKVLNRLTRVTIRFAVVIYDEGETSSSFAGESP